MVWEESKGVISGLARAPGHRNRDLKRTYNANRVPLKHVINRNTFSTLNEILKIKIFYGAFQTKKFKISTQKFDVPPISRSYCDG